MGKGQTYLLYPTELRKGYQALVVQGTSPSCKAYQRFTPSLGGNFGSSFFQIPHWPHFTVLSLIRQIYEVSSGTLAFAYIFPPFRVMAGLAPASS